MIMKYFGLHSGIYPLIKLSAALPISWDYPCNGLIVYFHPPELQAGGKKGGSCKKKMHPVATSIVAEPHPFMRLRLYLWL
jgi:hypothetical protein